MRRMVKELSDYIRTVGGGRAAFARQMDRYYEWGGPFDEDLFEEHLMGGVSGAAQKYAEMYGTGRARDSFTNEDMEETAALLRDEVKARYSLSDVARNLFLTLQTDGQVYQKSVSPFIDQCRARALAAWPLALLEQDADRAFEDIVTAHVPAFERQQALGEEPCKVTAADIGQVTRELKDYYFDEAGLYRIRPAVVPQADAPEGGMSSP